MKGTSAMCSGRNKEQIATESSLPSGIAQSTALLPIFNFKNDSVDAYWVDFITRQKSMLSWVYSK